MNLSNKVINSINEYLKLSKNYVLTIGVYIKGKTDFLVFENGDISKTNIYNYDLGSISKTFTAHLILSLVEEGKLNLETKIDEYLNLKPGNYPTIKDLLLNEAGYYYFYPIKYTIKPLFKNGYAKSNVYFNLNNEIVLKNIKNNFKNTNNFKYSDFSYAILALIIEKTLNISFDDALSEFLNKKLNLKETNISYKSIHNLNCYKKNKNLNYWNWDKNNPFIAGGGITSNIKDLLKYISLEIESDDFYITKSQEKSQEKGKIIPCLGWHSKENSNDMFHIGGVGTFRSSIIFNRIRKIGVIVLGNATGKKIGNVHYISNQIFSEIKRNKIKIN